MNLPSDTNQLRRHVRLLGDALGDILKSSEGEELFEKVEQIRQCSKDCQASETLDELYKMLRDLNEQSLLQIAKSFSQFLNLANIADQHHMISAENAKQFSARALIDRTLTQLSGEFDSEALAGALDKLKIDLVLTAHPTEITRRTLIHKHREISACLKSIDGLSDGEIPAETHHRIAELIAQIWHTNEFRNTRPSPVEEARWGFAVIENSLWEAIPIFLRDIDALCKQHGIATKPNHWQPIQISSWIGGDRDGNPNVTAEVSQRVLLLAQWQACELFLTDVSALHEELSVTTASPALLRACNHDREPYREILRPLRDLLRSQRKALEQAINNDAAIPAPLKFEQLLEPLQLCYESLLDCGIDVIAEGRLLDTIRRVHCFGPHLIKLDIRQESGRHRQAVNDITEALGLGSYADWPEEKKLSFLRSELNNPRPLIPGHWTPEPLVQEVLDTFAVIARTPATALGCYVISMASSASDVLAVQLLLKATDCPVTMPVSPLFETLDDLDNSPSVVSSLLSDADYLARISKQLTVMIGYSDSAKDAGMLSAGWAQYRAQEALLNVCEQYDVALQLFHGRGGSIGRGGAPAHQALLSQPPRSLLNGLRVTEQGEMIRTKLGLKSLAVNTLGQYASAILQAILTPPPAPKQEWRDLMNTLADKSCESYRHWVRGEENFVAYFRQATPEQELASLPLGSRPARRRTDGGIASLRAIPWIFAWSQNRLMLPAWLGAGEAISHAVENGHLETLREMSNEWPFFASRLSMLEMVYAKADLGIASLYDRMLVVNDLKPLGSALRDQLSSDQATLLTVLDQETLLEKEPWGLESISLRNVYTAPLNLIQVELLRRVRETPDPAIEQALMVSIAGVAAGMRNTG